MFHFVGVDSCTKYFLSCFNSSIAVNVYVIHCTILALLHECSNSFIIWTKGFKFLLTSQKQNLILNSHFFLTLPNASLSSVGQHPNVLTLNSWNWNQIVWIKEKFGKVYRIKKALNNFKCMYKKINKSCLESNPDSFVYW